VTAITVQKDVSFDKRYGR